MTIMKELIHNGILVTKIPYYGLSINIDGKPHKLTAIQEQMALAWVKKLDTVYVDDPVFCQNFFEDFSKALGYEKLIDENIDFSEVIDFIEIERAKKEATTKEEKKDAREKRKEEREKLKEIYGTAILDGTKVEIANWNAEPSSIFMGRGEHPMRGRWKEGPSEEDIILNFHSDKVPPPEGNWKEVGWFPECLWVAKWDDKLTGKTKYVWLSDSTPIKQDREIEKYDKINLVGNNLEKIRQKILEVIYSGNIQQRKIATACYIIDKINMRVGDEKDEDEADTVGATTLRTEHIKINGSKVTFNFLGKDSVVWNKEEEFPEPVIKVLQELMLEAKESNDNKAQVFSDISSRHVNAFLGEIVEGLTAKVFRTFHATNTVKKGLDEADVNSEDPDFVKKEAAVMANREAAIICNHMKQEPKNFENRLQTFRERKIKARERINIIDNERKQKEQILEELKATVQTRLSELKEQEKTLEQMKAEYNELRERTLNENQKQNEKNVTMLKKKIDIQKKKVETMKRRVEHAKGQVERGKNNLGTTKERIYKANLAFKKIESQERIAKKTKQWNLGTSIKSYVDPRVYYNWGKEIDYDWRNYYSATLQKKFSWLEREEEGY